jgi:SlyX protein
MENELIELQSQFAFQEDMLQELNLLVVKQQGQIDALQRELKLHADKLRELSARLPDTGLPAPGEERPPHY